MNSFKDLTPQEAIYRLTYYYKFAVVRHPLERLLSAYRNKLEHPVRYSGLNQFPDYAKVEMLSHFRAAQYQKWLRSWKTETNTSKIPAIFPTFTEFAEYMQVLPFNMYNEHFVPFLDLCHPCSVHYDFYIHFDTMVSDLHVLMDSLSIPTHYYPSAIPAPSHTSDLMKKYFGQLDSNTKVPLYRRFHNELDFYHALNFVSINNTFYV